jgi:uncharacterized protein YabE (DUF348 family)
LLGCKPLSISSIRRTAVGLVLLGLALIALGSIHPVEIDVDGTRVTKAPQALLTGQALTQAGVSFEPSDQVSPSPLTPFAFVGRIRVDHASNVILNVEPKGQVLDLTSVERIPANILRQAGIRLFATDQVFCNGQLVDPYRPLPYAPTFALTLRQAQRITVSEGSAQSTFYSSAPTLGEALWNSGLPSAQSPTRLSTASDVIHGPTTVSPAASREFSVHIGDQPATIALQGPTVGSALAEAGFALQGDDYSLPSSGEPLPADGQIQIVRVRNALSIEQEVVPFKATYVADPQLELDQRRIVQPGRYGVNVTTVETRYENGQEVSRKTLDQWQAQAPAAQTVGYGTKVVLQTLDTPAGPLQYWRKVNVYATSYSPCRVGAGSCHSGTASGRPLAQGIIAVTPSWYHLMANQRLYVPGYGTGVVADMGGGIPGESWIDLGYSDQDYVSWHQYVIVYFLTPVPSSIPWILP